MRKFTLLKLLATADRTYARNGDLADSRHLYTLSEIKRMYHSMKHFETNLPKNEATRHAHDDTRIFDPHTLMLRTLTYYKP